MTTDFITDLNKTFFNIKEQIISKNQGNNVSIETKYIEAVAVSLNGVESLPEEAPCGILTGLYILLCGDLKKMLQLQET